MHMYPSSSVLYFYPRFKRVSWSVIGRRHVEQLRRYLNVVEVDEGAIPYATLARPPVAIFHPYFYPLQAWEGLLRRRLASVGALIGIDVADSNRITERAVQLTQYATAMVVPSKFSRDAYVSSGVKVPVYVVPHGVDQSYIDAPPRQPSAFASLAQLKAGPGAKLIISYVLHSPYRKGLDILLQVYRELRRERRDVRLVIKDSLGVKLVDDGERYVYRGWLTEEQKAELFDLSDLYLLTSRGGGFEHPPLEALARGVPVLAAEGGSWQDYLPPWSLVPSRGSGVVLEGNSIHCGTGVEMVVPKAVERAHEVLDNLDEYRARVREHVDARVRQEFTWERVGARLADVIRSCALR